MWDVIVKRFLAMIPLLFGVTILVFLMTHFTPGDPARAMLGESATEEQIILKREELGLNDPLHVQYFNYLKGLVTRFDLGTSYSSGRSVSSEILARFPTTILLTLCGIIVTCGIGIPTGILSAVKQDTWIDKVCTVVALIGVSMPGFWFGLMLSYLFAYKLQWLPATGFYGPEYWILPAITVGLNTTATVMRFTRSQMLEVIRQDYIVTARAKGASEKRIILKHALKNSLIPVITVVGLQIGAQLGGAMVTETIFSVPGLGKYMVDAIQTRDYPVIQGGVLFIAIVFSVVNLLVDVLYTYVDPRIKAQFIRAKGKKKTAEKAVRDR